MTRKIYVQIQYIVYVSNNVFIYYLLIYFLERREGKEKERERNISVLEIHRSIASHMPPTGDLAHNPGMSPD